MFTEILAKYVADHYPEYGLTRRMAKLISDASPVHDIGKIGISEMVLLKPGRLTSAEFEMMKSHSEIGYEVIQSLIVFEGRYRSFCGEIALYHHERYDGKGYPKGLVGDEIPISAQIVSIADVYDTLITRRVYKKAYSVNQAYNMIMHGECGEFNPKLLAALSAVRGDFEAVAKKYKDD
jgi:putative two-component system response regulator